MKSIKTLAASLILAAMALSAQAAEAVIVQNGASGLYVVNSDDRMVQPYTADQIRVVRANGAQDYLTAAAYQTLRTRLLARGWVELFNGQGLANPGATSSVAPCVNGSVVFAWTSAVPQTFSDPGCVVYTALVQRAQTQQ